MLTFEICWIVGIASNWSNDQDQVKTFHLKCFGDTFYQIRKHRRCHDLNDRTIKAVIDALLQNHSSNLVNNLWLGSEGGERLSINVCQLEPRNNLDRRLPIVIQGKISDLSQPIFINIMTALQSQKKR